MNDWLADLRTRRLPDRLPMRIRWADACEFCRAHRMFPAGGPAIGGAVGLLFLGMRAVGVPTRRGGSCLGGGTILTAALHEDGISRCRRWIRGGRDTAAKLESCATAGSAPMAHLSLMVSFL